MQQDSAAKLGLTMAIAEDVVGNRFVGLPADVEEIAKHCILDFVGVAAAGSRDPLVAFLIEEAIDECNSGARTIIGRAERTTPLMAALVNGAAAHALDFDDVNLLMFGHPSAAILPALFSLAERNPVRGQDFIAAFAAGYSAACDIAAIVNLEHYHRGFHTTMTLGTFGAAAAAARLLGLSATQTAMALGIAGTQAAGLKCMFGTMTKPLHAGFAARNGLQAAMLAMRGFTACTDVLEARQGFLAAHGHDADAAKVGDNRNRYWISDTLFKFHAACFDTHAPLEAMRKLLASSVDADHVKSVTVSIPAELDKTCNIPWPQKGAEARFSLRFVIASALANRDTSDIALYSDVSIADPAITKFRDRINVDLAADLMPISRAVLRAELTDGTTVELEHDCGRPEVNLQLQHERLRKKFVRLAAPIWSSEKATGLSESIQTFDQLEDVDVLVRAFGV